MSTITYRLSSDHLFRASDRSWKKVKFHGILRNKFAEKSAKFRGTLGVFVNFAGLPIKFRGSVTV